MKIEYLAGDTIISLMPRREAMNYPAIAQVEAYWEGLRAGRLMPPRAEVDPRGMSAALEYAFILERVAPGAARFRLAGMHLSDLMGMDVRGMPLSAMFTAEARGQMAEVLESVFTTPQVVRVGLGGVRGIGRGPLEAQLLLCPLESDLGDADRVLGCLQTKGDIGRQPRRFEITSVSAAPLRAHEPLPQPTELRPSGDATSTKEGFAEPAALFEGQRPHAPQTARPKRGRPVLRVVRDDD